MLGNLSRSMGRMRPRAAFRRGNAPETTEVGKEDATVLEREYETQDAIVMKKENDVPLRVASTMSSDDEEPLPQRHTFPVSKKEIARGDHAVAVVWLMRELPKAEKLELRFFTSDAKEMSFEFTWQAEDGVSRSIDMEVSWSQAIPLGTTLLSMVAESCTNLRELTVFTGLETISEFSLSKLLNAFSTAGHWADTLERLEINWSRVEPGAFTRMQTFPQQLKSITFDGCLLIDEVEVNEFVSRLPGLESFEVVGSDRNSNRKVSMVSF